MGAPDYPDVSFSFAADQPAAVTVLSPVFLVIPHPGTTGISLVARDKSGTERYGNNAQGIYRAGHTIVDGGDVFAFSMGLFEETDPAVYFKVGTPHLYGPDQRPYLTSAGTTPLPTRFEDGVSYSAGTVVTLDNYLYAHQSGSFTEY
jgi:hypothetical protein